MFYLFKLIYIYIYIYSDTHSKQTYDSTYCPGGASPALTPAVVHVQGVSVACQKRFTLPHAWSGLVQTATYVWLQFCSAAAMVSLC
jgi:hypothetical protein